MSETAEFWKGEFGTAYTARCSDESLIAANQHFFNRIYDRDGPVEAVWPRSVIEFGANRGLNLRAIRKIDDELQLTAVEINPSACEELRKLGYVNVFEQSLLADGDWGQHDLSLSKGLLIHISPEDLPRAYSVLYQASKRYILTAEYFSREPTELTYRGHASRLWKRDFASEMLALFPNLKVIDYGFVWRLDPVAPQDDLMWALMEKPS